MCDVRELGGKDLGHWNLRLEPDHKVLPGTTPGYDHVLDGSTGFYGVKCEVEDGFSKGTFTLVLDGHYAGMNTDEGVLAKGGSVEDVAAIFVPSGTRADPGTPYDAGEELVDDPSLGDQEGQWSFSGTGGIASADSFAQWYRDVPGVNLSAPVLLTLLRQDDGTYLFDDTKDPVYGPLGGFFPIEDGLFGSSDGCPDRNFDFTVELHTELTYDADAGQFFRFVGDDDVWVFVDDRLAIDLGGIHGATDQFIDLDLLGLRDGETYALDFFFAERHRSQSNFRMSTNLEVSSRGLPSVTAAFD